MNTWLGYLVYFGGFFVLILLRAPHEKVSKATPIRENRMGFLERLLFASVGIGMLFFPILTASSNWLVEFDHSIPIWALITGTSVLAYSLWLFHRSHVDLGRNWSPTLQVREGHTLVSHGVYQSIRHPMYTAIFLFSIGQLIVLPNWISGIAGFVGFGLMFVLRVSSEEKMMRDQFGAQYLAYSQRTKRIVPGIW